ncbi:MAG: phosphoribosylformimino-5-aminoimidazole carboxamide ribotide isomerase [Verrucomicrobiales bacterium]|nr:phosphoribosylformimino-5-aminoimidazole carboxamide ribotide isomerase [Verrucomicrobiales bacterium]
MAKPKTKFRPCIDLHDGKVKQIVGGTLNSPDGDGVRENFVADESPAYFAGLYARDNVRGGHVIKLGPGNDEAAREGLAAYPDGLQIGGGIRPENAADWLNAGATHVIATSFLFNQDGHFQEENLETLLGEVGWMQLVIDLSCRKTENGRWVVAMNKWQTATDLFVTHETLDQLSGSCAEFLIHAADVEGKCGGIDEDLVKLLGSWGKKPVTYAGGARSLDDLRLVHDLSGGLVDLTIGSALDIFGGSLVKYEDCVQWNKEPPPMPD